jgi:hypothetical protein
MSIKSEKGLNYVSDFSKQCPQVPSPMEGDLSATITIYYASRRPDLDESLILDCMQSVTVPDPQNKRKRIVIRNNIYLNDRQVREKHIFWALDKENPRSEITIKKIKKDRPG